MMIITISHLLAKALGHGVKSWSSGDCLFVWNYLGRLLVPNLAITFLQPLPFSIFGVSPTTTFKWLMDTVIYSCLPNSFGAQSNLM